MATYPDALAADMRARAEAALKRTPSAWACDYQKSEGSYGSGEDVREGYREFVVTAPDAQSYYGSVPVVVRTECDLAEIHEEFDEDGGVAWDAVGKANAEHIAASDPPSVLRILDALADSHRLERDLRDRLANADSRLLTARRAIMIMVVWNMLSIIVVVATHH